MWQAPECGYMGIEMRDFHKRNKEVSLWLGQVLLTSTENASWNFQVNFILFHFKYA
jgi:hypothetical protein